jgi:competence protein ComEC
VVAIVALAIQVPVRGLATNWPPPGWTFVACDVGQGDGLALNAGPHEAVVIDTGPDPVAMDRCLRDLGINHIGLLVLSHFHEDHVGGISGAIRGRRVDEVLASPLPDPDGGVRQVREAIAGRGLPVLTPVPGAVMSVGQVRLEVLGPVATLHATHSDPNNNSLVLRATVAGTRILLPGDSEKEEQQELLDAHVDLSADVLKVAHHGSAYQQPAFLAAVHARVAVVSCGLHNDYGHPSATLLAEMARLGVPLRRTDLDGDIAVRGPPDHLEVTVRGKRASAVGA